MYLKTSPELTELNLEKELFKKRKSVSNGVTTTVILNRAVKTEVQDKLIGSDMSLSVLVNTLLSEWLRKAK